MKQKALAVISLAVLLLSSCGNEDGYQTKKIDVYREKDKVDTTLSLRFYDKTPNVPYIGVSKFYQEFFKTNLSLKRDGNVYRYDKGSDGYLKLDTQEDVITLFNIDCFGEHPDYRSNVSKTFLIENGKTTTPRSEKAFSLRNYKIDAKGDDEAYVPLALLSSLTGGLAGVNVAYNGKSIYVMDTHGELSGENKTHSYFGSSYCEVLSDTSTPRFADMAEYAYRQLCFNIDNLRGYTAQMIFGDNNILTLGLDGTLEKYYPRLKELLLSTNKTQYYLGYYVLFAGLFDGGHTAIDMGEPFITDVVGTIANENSLKPLYNNMVTHLVQKRTYRSNFESAKAAAFPEDYIPNDDESTGVKKKVNYYKFDNSSKTAYIGFDHFEVNYDQWNKYYTQGHNSSDIPVEGDSFAFVRSSLYRALDDHAENVILDLSTNGGGDSGALDGILGLFNQGKAYFCSNDVTSNSRKTEDFSIDINLDGEFNEADIEESNRFKSFKTAVLTSPCSFSCGNLLPSMMKEIGVKIVGKRSGGGSCAISYESTADGLTYYRSSHHCLSNASGDNIDLGVALDYEIQINETKLDQYGGKVIEVDGSRFYDFVTIADYLATVE